MLFNHFSLHKWGPLPPLPLVLFFFVTLAASFPLTTRSLLSHDEIKAGMILEAPGASFSRECARSKRLTKNKMREFKFRAMALHDGKSGEPVQVSMFTPLKSKPTMSILMASSKFPDLQESLPKYDKITSPFYLGVVPGCTLLPEKPFDLLEKKFPRHAEEILRMIQVLGRDIQPNSIRKGMLVHVPTETLLQGTCGPYMNQQAYDTLAIVLNDHDDEHNELLVAQLWDARISSKNVKQDPLKDKGLEVITESVMPFYREDFVLSMISCSVPLDKLPSGSSIKAVLKDDESKNVNDLHPLLFPTEADKIHEMIQAHESDDRAYLRERLKTVTTSTLHPLRRGSMDGHRVNEKDHVNLASSTGLARLNLVDGPHGASDYE